MAPLTTPHYTKKPNRTAISNTAPNGESFKKMIAVDLFRKIGVMLRACGRSLAILLAFGSLRGIAQESPQAAGDELRVLQDAAQPRLYNALLEEFDRQDALRQQAVRAALVSPQTLAHRQQQLRSALKQMIGPLPDRTPLNARTLGTLECDGYRIERVIYESRPNHHVTANLYLPSGASGTVPGVLVPCGHSENGKASEAYQSVCILLALNGCAALIYDPIGQGERHQLADPIRHGTTEHTLVGIGALLVGWNTATFRIWDGLRSMDYLASRPEVDPQRLGCTGNSGGGTMTTWLMAIDERISVAAPSCFVTTLERLFKTIGPQDCEQHFAGQGPAGIDHTDFITMRAPKPTLVLAAEQDFFDIGGTRTAAKQAEAVYQVLDHPAGFALFTHDDKHGFSQPRRQAAVAWMRRWLTQDEKPVLEPALTLQKDPALQVISTGQVMREFANETTIVQMSLSRANELARLRKDAWQAMTDAQRKDTIRRLLGVPGEASEACNVESLGTISRDGFSIEKLLLDSTGQLPMPALLCIPTGTRAGHPGEKRPGVVVVDSAGKAGAIESGLVLRYLRQNRVVLAVDLRGYGETRDIQKGVLYLNDAFRPAMLAMHLGQPLMGSRVRELRAAVAWLAGHEAVDGNDLRVVGVERAGPVALHAAVLDPTIASVTLRDSIRAWTDDVVARPERPQMLELAVPGVLEHYDLPELATMLDDRLHWESSADESASDATPSVESTNK